MGPKAAQKTNRKMRPSPKSARGLRERTRASFEISDCMSLFLDPTAPLLTYSRIEGGINEVREKVDGDIGKTDAEQASLDERVVAVADGGDGEASDAGPGEDGFGDDGSG